MNKIYEQSFQVSYQYPVCFTEDVFAASNTLLADILDQKYNPPYIPKCLFVIDEQVLRVNPDLKEDIGLWFARGNEKYVLAPPLVIPGGEEIKNSDVYLKRIIQAIDESKLDRHSFILAIGGGALLDLAGFAASIAHRGIGIIRLPTTVLSQDDSGMGVKNGINWFGKKNFIGTFAPPFAVINDFTFLTTLDDRHWRSGMAEAIKVALIKDLGFFSWIEAAVPRLLARDKESMQYLIEQSALLHLRHIAGEDPFERGSSRPLDFGHWSAHKLEQLSGFRLLHGEAVSIGIALDSTYSYLAGYLAKEECNRIVHLLERLGLPTTDRLIQPITDAHPLLVGLDEFREHLGGILTVTLLSHIGRGFEVNSMDTHLIQQAAAYLKQGIDLPS